MTQHLHVVFGDPVGITRNLFRKMKYLFGLIVDEVLTVDIIENALDLLLGLLKKERMFCVWLQKP